MTDLDAARDYLVWTSMTGQVFHVLPHGSMRDRHGSVTWTRDYAETGLEARPCRFCFHDNGTLRPEARAFVLALQEVDRAGEQIRAVTAAWDRHFEPATSVPTSGPS